MSEILGRFAAACSKAGGGPLCCLVLLLMCGGREAVAQERPRIVAFGASNTAGFGVGSADAYPAQLAQMLRARGHDVDMHNAGLSGDTAASMLARAASAVPAGTRVVILDPGNNDIKACTQPWRRQRCASEAEHAATVRALAAKLRAQGAAVLMANITFRGVPLSQWQADRRHLTAAGHRTIAARLVGPTIAALGSRR